MSRLNSFYLPPDQWNGPEESVFLEGPEARHLLQVLRTPVGSEVRLFDGQGRDGLFELTEAQRKRALLTPRRVTHHEPPVAGLTLALGWNKATRRGWLLEKSVELRAGGLAFWRARFSQGTPPPVKPSWEEKLVQAAKQCGNPWLPSLHSLSGLEQVVRLGANYDRCFLLWESTDAQELLRPSMLAVGRSLAVVGPEGGMAPEEVSILLNADFVPVSLGASILRWETAALHCLSLAHYGSTRAQS
jgi:16S rRNA (uracil1498-N3)-methyltransferase